jgi:hypothetical protein
MARFGRNEGLCHWLTLESWLGMVIDAILIKAKTISEADDPSIIGSMLGKDAAKLIPSIQAQFCDHLERQAVTLSPDLINKTSELLLLAGKRWSRIVKGEEEGPTPLWLKRYLSKEVTVGTYKAWDKKDLVWAVYSFFL